MELLPKTPLSDCQLVYITGREGHKYPVFYHNTDCLLDPDNEYWDKNNNIGSWLKLIRRHKNTDHSLYYNIKRIVRKVVFIFMDMLMEDLIEYNYGFSFPNINGGFIFIGSIKKSVPNMIKTNSEYFARLVHLDFNRGAIRTKRFKPFIDYKYYKRIKNNVKRGHKYLEYHEK